MLTLGWRLFWMRGAAVLVPAHAAGPLAKPGVSWSGDVDDAQQPGTDRLLLGIDGRGCDWLLDRWAELRRVLGAETTLAVTR